MAINHSKEQLRNLYLKLPEEVKEVLNSEETLDKTQEIGKKFNLHIDKVGILGKNIGYLILGALRPKEFIPQLSAELGVPTDQAQKIAQEINEHIFAPIRESLKRIHGLDGNKPLQEELASVPDSKPTPANTTFDDRIGKYLSTNKPSENTTLSPRPYTQDPYREQPNSN